MDQSNQSNVSRETIRTPSSYKVRAVKELLNLRAHMFGTALALLVKHNWDGAQAQYDPAPSSARVTYLPIVDLNMKLYFAPSVNPSQGVGLHMLIVKNEEPTYVLFIGFYEFSIICQIVAGIGQMKLVRGIDECREVKTRQWVMSNVDKLSHRLVTCLFGSDLKELYILI
jgi:hypothetical protein